jgi:DNA replication protein DnaC
LQKTAENSNRLEDLIERMRQRQELTDDAPAVSVIVSKPDECPLSSNYCVQCTGEGFNLTRTSPELKKTYYDIMTCYLGRRYQNLLEKSGLFGEGLRNTFENAIVDQYNKKLFPFLKAQWTTDSGKSLFIKSEQPQARPMNNPGGNGTGKSYALEALTHRLCREGISCLYLRSVDFTKILQNAFNPDNTETEMAIIKKFQTVPVLLLDDFGKEAFKTDWAPQRFFDVIDYRARAELKTVYSSNFDFLVLEQHFGPNYGPAIVSRLAGSCDVWELGGPDRRLDQAKKGAGQ